MRYKKTPIKAFIFDEIDGGMILEGFKIGS
jgi:hypothetical protein